MAESDSFSSVLDPPGYLDSKYGALDLNGLFSFSNGKEYDSNSEGIIKALKVLQEKIRLLESDKTAASKKFEELTSIVRADISVSPGVEDGKHQEVEVDHATKFSTVLNDSLTSPTEIKRKNVQQPKNYGRHYHLNFKDIPFILGMSTSPSHSLIANYQQLLAVMKRHGPLCQVKTSGIKCCQLSKHCKALQELSSLLDFLYDEIQILCCEYENHHISSHLCQCEGSSLCERKNQLESTQIKLRLKLDKLIEYFQCYCLCCQSPFQPSASSSGCVQNCSQTVDDSTLTLKHPSHLLKKIKQVQKTLQRNDLYWQ